MVAGSQEMLGKPTQAHKDRGRECHRASGSFPQWPKLDNFSNKIMWLEPHSEAHEPIREPMYSYKVMME